MLGMLVTVAITSMYVSQGGRRWQGRYQQTLRKSEKEKRKLKKYCIGRARGATHVKKKIAINGGRRDKEEEERKKKVVSCI